MRSTTRRKTHIFHHWHYTEQFEAKVIERHCGVHSSRWVNFKVCCQCPEEQFVRGSWDGDTQVEVELT